MRPRGHCLRFGVEEDSVTQKNTKGSCLAIYAAESLAEQNGLDGWVQGSGKYRNHLLRLTQKSGQAPLRVGSAMNAKTGGLAGLSSAAMARTMPPMRLPHYLQLLATWAVGVQPGLPAVSAPVIVPSGPTFRA